MLVEIPPAIPRTIQVFAALDLLEIPAHAPRAPALVAGQLRDVVPVAVVRRDENQCVMRGAATKGASARIKDPGSPFVIDLDVLQIVMCIPLLLLRVVIVMDVEFPRELIVFRTARMPGGDLVLVVVGLFLVAGFENENAVASLGEPHRHRPAAGTGPDDNEIVFIAQFVCG